MKVKSFFVICTILIFGLVINCYSQNGKVIKTKKPYDISKMYDESAPQPPVVTPPKIISKNAPSDAIILFDGTDLSKWTDSKGNPAKWKVENG